ncbi:TcpQ domain-containing protein [Massilia sp. YIM B04103]|uniref:TcpQ domain-containing protein n=1 Tax=Massilia sp. YIM B04103 TaxID=2963106 RepID=UPI00210D783E|nr:TcpQ domain-containing protein [Massilia sp. YIM B04103]
MSITITLNGAARRTCAVLGLSLCCGALAMTAGADKPAAGSASAAPAAAQPAAPQSAASQAAASPAAAAPAAKEKPRATPAKKAQRADAGAKARATAVAAVPAPVPVPAVRAAQDAWDISPSDLTLNAALARWAAAAGWQLLWELPVDYAVQVRTTVSGSFEDAVGTVITSLDSAEMPMKAVFYKGNKVLRIMGRGVQ